MDRRAAVLSLLAFGAAPPGALAQQTARVSRLGVLLYTTPRLDPNVATFREELRKRGYMEGKNLLVDYRFAEGNPDRLADLAVELVNLKPDVIFALGGDVIPAARKATRTVPIVMWASNDPVQTGVVASLARPGGNITGITLVLDALAGKRVALLKEAVPQVTRAGVLWDPNHADPEFRAMQDAARSLGVQLQSMEVHREADFDVVLQAGAKERMGALIVVSSRLLSGNRSRILEFATRNGLPLVGDWGPWAAGGGLLDFGPNIDQMVRRCADYVDRILRGAKPAQLPVEQPTKFELVINLKTARALGLTVSPSLLLRADQVIQ